MVSTDPSRTAVNKRGKIYSLFLYHYLIRCFLASLKKLTTQRKQLLDPFSMKLCILLIFLQSNYCTFRQLGKQNLFWVSPIFHKVYVNSPVQIIIRILTGMWTDVRRMVSWNFTTPPLLFYKNDKQYNMYRPVGRIFFQNWFLKIFIKFWTL